MTTSPPSNEPAIAVEGLTKRYGSFAAVEDLSFTVRRGVVTGFLGPNGAGKTTALKVITGLAGPTEGRVTVLGEDTRIMCGDARRMGVYIEPSGAHPGRSARNHLRSLAALADLPKERVDEVLETVGLSAAADRRVGGFSMGMRQRLGLAAALLGDPEVLVLDEPLNGLDPQGIRWIRTFLRERAMTGKTVLLSSHVLTEAAQTIDDVVVIAKGRMVQQGPIHELERQGGASVLVRTPTPERLARAAQEAGGCVAFENGHLRIEGMDTADVGELAHGERVLLHELTQSEGSLEDVFFALTGEESR